MNRRPLISVLMPTFNCADYLAESVACVLAQSLDDLEFIAVDDGSTDETASLLATLARKDQRIRVVSQTNGGAGAALNTALALARGKYLARMDADDRTPPGRFAEEVAFLETHPAITVVGGWHQTFGAGESRVHEFPTDPDHVKAALLFRNPISHPTVMMRRGAFIKNAWRYSTQRDFPEDYDLWVTIAQQHELANLPKIYLDYRIQPGAVAQNVRRHWPEKVIGIQCRLLDRLGVVPDEQERAIHTALAFDQIPSDAGFIETAHAWLLKIYRSNQQQRAFEENGLIRVLTGRYIALRRAAAGNGEIPGLDDSPFRPFVTVPLP